MVVKFYPDVTDPVHRMHEEPEEIHRQNRTNIRTTAPPMTGKLFRRWHPRFLAEHTLDDALARPGHVRPPVGRPSPTAPDGFAGGI